MRVTPNKSLQVTFDPLLTFAAAKAAIASNAPERGRYMTLAPWMSMVATKYVCSKTKGDIVLSLPKSSLN